MFLDCAADMELDPEPGEADGGAPADPRSARQLAELEAMVGAGFRMLAAFERQVEVETRAMEAGEARVDGRSRESTALAFCRISRAIRLSQRLERQVAGLDAAPAQARPARTAPAPVGAAPPATADPAAAARGVRITAEKAMRRLRLLTRRHDVRNLVARAIDIAAHERGEAFDREAAEYEMIEALEDPATPDAVWLWRPLGELAADLCRDLGVRYDPNLWAEAGFADEPTPDNETPNHAAQRLHRLFGTSIALPEHLYNRFRRVHPPP
jgi:hypothetical protein